MARTTRADIDRLTSMINRELNRPTEPYTDGKPNAGHISLDSVSGRLKLVEMNSKGGERGLTSRMKIGEFYTTLEAILTGIYLAKKEALSSED